MAERSYHIGEVRGSIPFRAYRQPDAADTASSRGPAHYCAVRPPSTTRPAPVMKPASSEARKRMPLAMSVGVPSRPIGWVDNAIWRAASTSLVPILRATDEGLLAHIGLDNAGWIELTRIR